MKNLIWACLLAVVMVAILLGLFKLSEASALSVVDKPSEPLVATSDVTEDYDVQPAGGEWMLNKTYNPQH